MRPLHRMNPARMAGSSQHRASARNASRGGRVLAGLARCSMSAAAPGWRRGAGPARLRRARPGRRRRGDRGGPRACRRPGPVRSTYRDRRRRGPAGRGRALPGHHRARGDRARARTRPPSWPRSPDCWSRAGRLFLSTLNRTPRSFLAAKVGAEYLLRWLPVGTHDWRKFITPGRTGRHAAARRAARGRHRRPGRGPADRALAVSRDLGVNYVIAAEN